MMEPFSLAALGTVALTQGITFLYNQATEILKRRRERQAAAEAVPVETPEVLEGELQPVAIDPAAADELAEELKLLRAQLGEYAQGTEEADPSDASVVRATEALRDAIESIIGQRITFKGEQREPSGRAVVTGTVRAREIRARASGVDADSIGEAEVRGDVQADVIGEGADVAGAGPGRSGPTGRGSEPAVSRPLH
jgi:hypothetical protein